jgi:Leucine-rich repeat (LRR) protein
MNPNRIRQSNPENVDESTSPQATSAVMGTTYITMPTPQSIMDEFYHSNKRPLPSGKSPRQEKLLQNKTASEEKLRSLMHSMSTTSHPTDIPRTAPQESKIRTMTSDSSKSRPTKSSQHSRTGRASTTTKSQKQSHSHSHSHSNDDDRNRRTSRSVAEPRRRRKKTKQATTTMSRKSSLQSHPSASKSSSPESSSEWGIPSVMGDSTESWQHFEPSEAEFSESGYYYDDSGSSRRSSIDIDNRMETPGSLLNKPASLSSIQIVGQAHDANVANVDRFPPMPKAADWLSGDDEDDDDNDDEDDVEPIASSNSLLRPPYQRQPSYTSRGKGEMVSSSISKQQSSTTYERPLISNADQQDLPRSKDISTRQLQERNKSLKRQKSILSNPSLESTNPTPSVIVKGVKEVAAKLDVNIFQPSPVTTTKDKSRLELLLDENNFKARLQTSLQSRSSRRKLIRKSLDQSSVQSDGYELVMGDGAESMSTLSHDNELDPVNVIPMSLDVLNEDIDTMEESIEFSSFSSQTETTASNHYVYENKSNLEHMKQQRLTRTFSTSNTSKRSKLKSSTQSLLADVLEVSVEGSATDDDSPARIQSIDSIVSTKPLHPLTQDTGTMFTNEQLMQDNRNEESIEVAYPEPTDYLETRNINLSDNQSETTTPFEPRRRKFCRSNRMIVFTTLLLIAAIVSVIVVIYFYARTPRALTNDEIFMIISSIAIKDVSVLKSATTIQGKALIWLQESTARRRQADRNRILQRYALATLYFSTQGDEWIQNNGWLSDDDECSWFFTSRKPCNEEGMLVSLSLSSNNLAGEIPEETAIVLSSLTTCDLQKNRLSGTFPRALLNCINLQQLDLASNWFDPQFPTWITHLTNLRVLNLDMNLLTGSLPTSISRMTNLEVFSLAGNHLTGAIPTDITAMMALRVLNLKFNQLLGPIPGELMFLRNLSDLILDVNPFYDNFPTELFRMSALRQLSCNYCSLRGRLPTEIGLLKNIEILDFRSNQWIGSIPSSIGLISKIRRIDFSGNKLSGSLPMELGMLINLYRMDLSRNNLSGSIPLEFSSLFDKDLVMHLDGNPLTGTVPTSLCVQIKEHGGLLSLNETKVVHC